MSVVPLELVLPAGALRLPAILNWPAQASGLVIFAHGSGSGRFSPRNNAVATHLGSAGLGSLLLDLLTEDEAKDRRLVFDIPLLASRLEAAAYWALHEPRLVGIHLGLFGASTGAAAALQVAASDPAIRAVVSRGGRPDLALEVLPRVKAPTLLIVGGADHQVIAMNRQALKAMVCEKEMILVPGATHLFEEPGALERVSELAKGWFLRHLGGAHVS